jgi:hypothetical protein
MRRQYGCKKSPEPVANRAIYPVRDLFSFIEWKRERPIVGRGQSFLLFYNSSIACIDAEVSKCMLQGARCRVLLNPLSKHNNKDKETAFLVRHAMLTPPATDGLLRKCRRVNFASKTNRDVFVLHYARVTQIPLA